MKLIGIVHDDPDVTPPDKVRYDAAVTVNRPVQPEGEFGVMEFAGGSYAVVTPQGALRGLGQDLPADLRRLASPERIPFARCAGFRAVPQFAAEYQAGRFADPDSCAARRVIAGIPDISVWFPNTPTLPLIVNPFLFAWPPPCIMPFRRRISVSDPSTYWLNITNIALGVVVSDLLRRRCHRRRAGTGRQTQEDCGAVQAGSRSGRPGLLLPTGTRSTSPGSASPWPMAARS